MSNSPKIGNRRGRQSRQEILDAAARVMAAYGYAGTSMSALVEATGIPKSAIYHHFGSKAGLLAEVMALGAREFFAAMRDAHQCPPEGTPRERLCWYLQKTGEVFQHHENFMRLQFLLVMTAETVEPEAMQTIIEIRKEGRDYMQKMIRNALGADRKHMTSKCIDDLAHFGLAGFDGAFISLQSGDPGKMARHMEQLTDALIALADARPSNGTKRSPASKHPR
ncbi:MULTISPECIES: TetR/AcrR family transcriptional regulator [Burkholderia]|uniref:TetR/AcrR family transcriptional regulator n=1 Tax=Burkholderia TaxID=32008 RepID=UPI000BF84CB4|nr:MULTISPECIES: TetR/AcrR family transcriptional regulator [Burkholderia]PFH21069.1 TetR family transcriptional regulator [Burkholderia sp. JKS000303]